MYPEKEKKEIMIHISKQLNNNIHWLYIAHSQREVTKYDVTLKNTPEDHLLHLIYEKLTYLLYTL